MPTLLQINSSANWGSTGRIAEQIGQVAIKHGWNSYIAYGRYVNDSSSHLIKIGNKLDLAYHLFISRYFDKHGLGSIYATRRFIKKIEKIKPDVIHLHNIHGYYINYRILFEYLAKADIPVVWTFHDCWPITGHCAYFDSIDCEKWMTGCYDCQLKGTYPKSAIFDISKSAYVLKKELFTSVKSITLVPVSEWLADIISNSYLQNYPIKVIHNGIDTASFIPSVNNLHSHLGIAEDKTVILGVAAIWDARKGLNDLIKLSKNANYQIIVVGVSAEQKESLPFHIIGVKRTQNQHELAEYYSMADVFVNPTYSDNFPTTNIEALACGTPVITYRTGGSPEAVDERTGIVVEAGNIKQLANAVETVKRNGKSYYSDACRRRAVECFNKDDRYEEYFSIYQKLV